MNDLQLLREINSLALGNDEGAKKLILEWLNIDLTDFGSKDMIACKMQSYIEGNGNGRKTKRT